MGTSYYDFYTGKIAEMLSKSAKLEDYSVYYMELNEDGYLFKDYLPAMYKSEDEIEYLKILFKARILIFKDFIH